MNENMNPNTNWEANGAPTDNTQQAGNFNAAPVVKEKKDVKGFFERNNKVIGTCIAAAVAIVIIIAGIFVSAAAANISRTTKQQQELNAQMQQYLDQGNLPINIYGGQNPSGANGGTDIGNGTGDFNLEDLIDLFGQFSGDTGSSSSNNTGSYDINAGSSNDSVNWEEIGNLIDTFLGSSK